MDRHMDLRKPLFLGAMASLFAMTVLLAPNATAMERAAQKIFASPQQAVAALVAAVQDDGDAGLLAVLGPEAQDLISSGDAIADHNGRARFLEAYGAKSRLEQESPDRAVLVVGEKEYPFPIPIVRQGDSWRFDTLAGRVEILNRRIGRNELHTLEVLRAYVDAQREYASRKRDGGVAEFAQKFSSSEGARDGLYWETAEGEQESPLGPLVAQAAAEGYGGGLAKEPPEPFHGYYFKILKAQGEHAAGGAFDYVADGRMILGFALVAYPARYGVSGITSFIVNQGGEIYEKDLGRETAQVAAAMAVFDPDESWRRHEEPAER